MSGCRLDSSENDEFVCFNCDNDSWILYLRYWHQADWIVLELTPRPAQLASQEVLIAWSVIASWNKSYFFWVRVSIKTTFKSQFNLDPSLNPSSHVVRVPKVNQSCFQEKFQLLSKTWTEVPPTSQSLSHSLGQPHSCKSSGNWNTYIFLGIKIPMLQLGVDNTKCFLFVGERRLSKEYFCKFVVFTCSWFTCTSRVCRLSKGRPSGSKTSSQWSWINVFGYWQWWHDHQGWRSLWH